MPSVMHYLTVDPDKPLVIHHVRSEGEIIATRVVREGTVSLAQPGMDLPLVDIYGA